MKLHKIAITTIFTAALTINLTQAGTVEAATVTPQKRLSATECAKIVQTNLPAWFKASRWYVKCTPNTYNKWESTYITGKREIQIKTPATKSDIQYYMKWALNEIPKDYRNDPVKDCNRVVAAYKPHMKSVAPKWNATCTLTSPRYTGGNLGTNTPVIGLATYTTRQILIYSGSLTLKATQDTVLHEIAHAATEKWTNAEIRNWEKLTKSVWDTHNYADRGSEMWAESYAAYILKRPLQEPITKVFPAKVVKKQLDYVRNN